MKNAWRFFKSLGFEFRLLIGLFAVKIGISIIGWIGRSISDVAGLPLLLGGFPWIIFADVYLYRSDFGRRIMQGGALGIFYDFICFLVIPFICDALVFVLIWRFLRKKSNKP